MTDIPCLSNFDGERVSFVEKRMKYVFFTGATGGFGECCVRALAQKGWTVFAGGTNESKLKALESIPRVIPAQADVTCLKSLQTARELVLGYTDRLDAVVNFAGVTAFTSLVEGDPAGISQRLLDINVMGMIRVNQVFFDLLERGHGRIVNCSSSAGWMTAQPFAGPYVLSKRAVEAYSDSLRRELMFLDIPVIKIQPGAFRTAIETNVEDGYQNALRRTTRYSSLLPNMKPLMDTVFKSAGDPERVAGLVVKVLEAKRPKARYRIGSGLLLCLLELLPEPCVDQLYKALYRQRK